MKKNKFSLKTNRLSDLNKLLNDQESNPNPQLFGFDIGDRESLTVYSKVMKDQIVAISQEDFENLKPEIKLQEPIVFGFRGASNSIDTYRMDQTYNSIKEKLLKKTQQHQGQDHTDFNQE